MKRVFEAVGHTPRRERESESGVSDGKGGPGYTIEDEFSRYPHRRGVVAMANTGVPNSAGSQFFIGHQDSLALDGRYTIFARVVEGIETVDAITEVEIDKFGRYGPPDRPYPEPVVIASIRLTEAPSRSRITTSSAGSTSAPPS